MLNIEKSSERDVLIIGLNGQIDGGPKSQKIQEIIKNALSEGMKKFVLDMNDVQWLNSLGAGVLIASYASVRRSEGSINLVGISDRVKVVLRTCGLVPTVFKEFENKDDAIQDLQ
jgi:anti-sigma B factor antagonist